MIQKSRIIQFIYKAPVFLIGIVGYYFAILLILNYREDTTKITNAGFAIMATLSALSFSFARVVETSELKDRLMFAGERFLHGGLLTLVASLLKYFVSAFIKFPAISNLGYAEQTIQFSIGLLIAIIFVNGVLFAHTGLRVLNDLLLLRFTRHKDWDDMW